MDLEKEKLDSGKSGRGRLKRGKFPAQESFPAKSTRFFDFQTFSSVLPPFLLSRTLILLLIVFAANVEFTPVPAREGKTFHPYWEHSLEDTPSAVVDSFERVFGSADGAWYQKLAKEGYDQSSTETEKPKNWVFFPLYPLLVRLLSSVLDKELWVAIALSNLFALGGLYVLSRYLTLLGVERSECKNAVWLCCFFPTSYFFSAPITESLFFVLSVLAFYSLERGRLLSAGFWMMLVTATRPTGIMILPAFALGLLYVRQRNPNTPLLALLGSLFLAPLGALAFSAYLWLSLGSPLAFIDNQKFWGRGLTPGFEPLFSSLPVGPWNFSLLNLCFAGLVLAASAYLVNKRRVDLAVFLLLPVGIALATGTVQSMTRFVMVLFPLYFVFARVLVNQNAFLSTIALFAMLLSVMTVAYALHVSIAMA